MESKDENIKCIQKTILTKLKITFLIFIINIKGFFSLLLIKKNIINYEILSSKADNIIFYDRYNTLYNYFSKLSAEESSIKNKSFLEDLSKGFKLKSVYTTKGENNIEKAYYDLVLNNKKIDDALYKKVNNELSNKNKNIFQEVKKLFDLRIEIYKKLVLEEKNLKFGKSIGETVK